VSRSSWVVPPSGGEEGAVNEGFLSLLTLRGLCQEHSYIRGVRLYEGRKGEVLGNIRLDEDLSCPPRKPPSSERLSQEGKSGDRAGGS